MLLADEFFELKTLHYGRTTYPTALYGVSAPAELRCGAVNRRADALPAQLATKVRQIDERYCGRVHQ